MALRASIRRRERWTDAYRHQHRPARVPDGRGDRRNHPRGAGMIVRVTQLDGKLPNLALMRLAAWHSHEGDEVHWERGTSRGLYEPDYDIVYGSAIFSTSAKAVELFRSQFPGAIVGGSGGDKDLRVDDIVPTQFRGLDYSGYPDFTASIGYAMRGCRLRCGHCVVPDQEGAARANRTIAEIWRGPGWPLTLHLLDNDFFGNPDWRPTVEAIRNGGFKVCINQGINIRTGWFTDEQAEAIASLKYKDDQFSRPRIYTAWDMIGHERIFFEGVDRLERAGVPPHHLMAYMLVGYDPRETWEKVFHRYERMNERGMMPYPMVHDRFRDKDLAHWRKLKLFQSWVITGAHKVDPFAKFRADHKRPPEEGELIGRMAA
jgi:hypothetical protein